MHNKQLTNIERIIKMNEETAQKKLLTYSTTDMNNHDSIYYCLPENTSETELHMLFAKGKNDDENIKRLQQITEWLNKDNKKHTVIMSPISEEEITDVIQNYEKDKLDKLIDRMNKNNSQVMLILKREGISSENTIDILTESENEQKFSTWLSSQYQGYYETHDLHVNTNLPENNVGSNPTYQENGIEMTDTLTKPKTLTLKPPKKTNNSGFVSWYGITLTLMFALAVGYSIAYVIWNYLK